MQIPTRFEDADPEAGAALMDICQERARRSQQGFGLSKLFLEVKVGRNDACPCESGRKYKRCCGK